MKRDPKLAAADDGVKRLAKRWANLADARLGAEAIHASDEFFAPKERLLNPEPAVFRPGEYDDHGKWMDGWESRRKRSAGHDHCIIRLGVPGTIHAVDIDTSHFTGNFAPAASLDAASSEGNPDETTLWTEILPAVGLAGDSHHPLEIEARGVFSHVRLNIYPDGGVARLRVFGRPAGRWEEMDRGALHELSAFLGGGHVVAYNDAHFGNPIQILTPGRGKFMGDGWETRRRREPGNDWIIIALGQAGTIERIEVDTAHFKGNYPDRCSVQGALVEGALMRGGTERSLVAQSMFWDEILPERKLEMDRQHVFDLDPGAGPGRVSHVRLNIFPDGGISRFRVFGRIA